MKHIFNFLLLLCSLNGIAQNTERTVEVTGNASKKFLADKYYLTVTVKGNGQCEIPSGKHYQKYIKECRENNKKVVASREDILKGIITYFGSRVITVQAYNPDASTEAVAVAVGDASSEYESSPLSKNYLLEFGLYADATEFISTLKDYKRMIDPGVLTASCSKLLPSDFEEIKMESLKDARRKADLMAKTLNAELGMAKNIYEEKPEEGGSWNNYLRSMGAAEAATPDYLPSAWSGHSYGEGSIPDSEGYLTFSRSTFVRFYLK